MSRKHWIGWVLAGLGGLPLGVTLADEGEEKEPAQAFEVRIVADTDGAEGAAGTLALNVKASDYWLGVMCAPLGQFEELKSHLGLEQGLVVMSTVDGSPAAKAGVKKHDILLSYGDTKVDTLERLMDAVDQRKEQETDLTLIRGGKEMKLKVAGAKRPAEAGPQGTLARGLHRQIEEMLKDRGLDGTGHEGLMRFFKVHPGMVLDDKALEKLSAEALGQLGLKFPANLKVSISKEGDQPARITVERDGKKWEVTEDKLNELPEDVRPFIEGYVHGGRFLGPGMNAFRIIIGENGEPGDAGKAHQHLRQKFEIHRAHPKDGDSDRPARGAEKQPGAKRTAGIEKREAIDELRDEIKELKQAIEQLQKSRSEK